MKKDISNLTISGEVVHGEKRARDLGYPTANLDVKLEDQDAYAGVYASIAAFEGQEFVGALVILPTKIEVHLIDAPVMDLYGKTLFVSHIQKVSDIEPYTSDQQMKDKISNDITAIRYVYRDHFSSRNN